MKKTLLSVSVLAILAVSHSAFATIGKDTWRCTFTKTANRFDIRTNQWNVPIVTKLSHEVIETITLDIESGTDGYSKTTGPVFKNSDSRYMVFITKADARVRIAVRSNQLSFNRSTGIALAETSAPADAKTISLSHTTSNGKITSEINCENITGNTSTATSNWSTPLALPAATTSQDAPTEVVTPTTVTPASVTTPAEVVPAAAPAVVPTEAPAPAGVGKSESSSNATSPNSILVPAASATEIITTPAIVNTPTIAIPQVINSVTEATGSSSSTASPEVKPATAIQHTSAKALEEEQKSILNNLFTTFQ
jgi:hypothetical protein